MKKSRCPCLRPEDDEVRVLDYRHCSLENVPADVFNWERTLEELYVDANQIRDLPRVRHISLFNIACMCTLLVLPVFNLALVIKVAPLTFVFFMLLILPIY